VSAHPIEPTRRQAVAGTAAALAAGPALAGAPARPNILFILADDLGYADLSCYGQRAFITPVLDRLAADGLQMSQGYANSAVCSATRTALITGRYQHRLPIGLREPVADLVQALPDGKPTLASQLRALGYRTSLIGKWHLGAYPDHNPRKSGYDYCFGFTGGGSDYFSHSGPDKRADQGLWENETPVDRPGYLTDLLAERAIAEIGVAADRRAPFFMSLHFNAPHWPWEGPDDRAVSRSLIDVNTPLRQNDGGSLAKFGEMVRSMDAAIGRVLAAVKARGLERDTLVVFTSDNGGERFSQTWPFIGQKGELLEGGLRTPLIVRWPARIRRGSRSEQVMITMDWLPTLLRAAGGAPDPAYPPDGEDLLGVLTGSEPVRPRKLYWRYYANDQAALRDGDWKYLRLGGKEYLFDLAADAHERADLKARRPEVFQRLKADWAGWASGMLPYPPGMISESPKPAMADRY
jgi:arylsulfatase A-like enzyme